MNKSTIIAKLETYIKEYSKLLEINTKLKEELEKEKIEKEVLQNEIEKYKEVVNNSTRLVEKTMINAEIIMEQIEKYKKEMNEIFNDFNEIIDDMLNNNGDKKDIEERMKKIYNKINKPIE